MRRIVVLLAVLSILLAAQVSQAADLQAGWYVKLGWVMAGGWSNGQLVATDWAFTTAPGNYGPFEVTSPDSHWPERTVSITNSVYGVASGTSVYLWGQPEYSINFAISDMGPKWETNYDASQVRLELLMYREDKGYTLLWAQNCSGYNSGFRNVLGESQVIPEGYTPVFRVTTLPEPSTLTSCICGILAFIPVYRRRRQ